MEERACPQSTGYRIGESLRGWAMTGRAYSNGLYDIIDCNAET